MRSLRVLCRKTKLQRRAACGRVGTGRHALTLNQYDVPTREHGVESFSFSSVLFPRFHFLPFTFEIRSGAKTRTTAKFGFYFSFPFSSSFLLKQHLFLVNVYVRICVFPRSRGVLLFLLNTQPWYSSIMITLPPLY